MNIKPVSLLIALMLLLTGCGAGGSSSGGLVQERQALECIDVSGSSANNTCDFSVVFRVFIGADGTPITILPNSSAQIVGLTSTVISFGACKAPFVPTDADIGFECL